MMMGVFSIFPLQISKISTTTRDKPSFGRHPDNSRISTNIFFLNLLMKRKTRNDPQHNITFVR